MHAFQINAATSIFPGWTYLDSISRLHEGVTEYLGPVLTNEIQLCPQNRGFLSEKLCDHLMEQFPKSRFRLHANVKVKPKLQLFDLSTDTTLSESYFLQLAKFSRRVKAPLYSLHAGSKKNCSKTALIDRLKKLEDMFDCPVAVEGGYPNLKQDMHLSTWEDLSWLLDQEVNFVIDLSHLNIIRCRLGENELLVKQLIDSPHCREIHISSNNGDRDSHLPVYQQEWWTDLLRNARSVLNHQAQVFSEGNQLTKAYKQRGFSSGTP